MIFVPHPSTADATANRSRHYRRRWALAVVLSACAALVTCGCGGQPDASAGGPPTVGQATAQSTPTVVSSAPTSESSDFPSPSDGTSDSDPSEGPSEGESEKPPVLDKTASGRDLTTADFFRTPEQWRDGRFNVAGKQGLAGIAGPLDDCVEDASEYTATIELRLANNFSRISMKLGQGDDSESSDAVVQVKVLGNGKYLDSARVDFNKIQSLDASVVDVNALKIQVWRGGEKCESSSPTEAVLMELRVE